MTESAPSKKWGAGTWALVIVIPLIASILLSLFIRRPIVGVIYLDDAIYSTSAQQMVQQIDFARQNPRVRAVVLVINSPGGTVSDTEAVYLEMARLRETKPFVTMIEGMAASGGYYLSAGSDYIMAKASSEVGNVGVLGYLPDKPQVFDGLYSTGPYKLWGSPQETFIREMEMLKEGFLQVVKIGRGERLQVADEVILRGQIWTGAEALRMGLIDELGARSQAFEKAAKLAHISHYRVEDLRPLAGLPEVSSYYFFMTDSNGHQTAYPDQPGIYLLYVPLSEVQP